MDDLEQFAQFLKAYGAYAMASIFAFLYAMERRERRVTQEKYESHLVEIPRVMQDFGDAQADALENLERAFLRRGIDVDAETED